MKHSKYLLLAALLLSAAGHAQAAQTFYFGEGQSAPQHGHATSAPPRNGGESNKTQHHRHHTTHHSPPQNQYSHP